MLRKLLAITAPVAVVGILLVPISGAALAQPSTGLRPATDYYDYDLDNLYDIDPRNYGYLPRAYEYPWLYQPTWYGGAYYGPYGYRGPSRTALPVPGADFYNDGYEDDDWYFDYYDSDGGYYTGLDYRDRRTYRGVDYDVLRRYYPPNDALLRSFVPTRMPSRYDHDEWFRETYGDDGFDGVEKPEIEWYDW